MMQQSMKVNLKERKHEKPMDAIKIEYWKKWLVFALVELKIIEGNKIYKHYFFIDIKHDL